MRLSDLFSKLNSVQEVVSLSVYLAVRDEDGTDLDLASVGRVEVDYAAGVARLYPASTSTEPDSAEPERYSGMVLSQLSLRHRRRQ